MIDRHSIHLRGVESDAYGAFVCDVERDQARLSIHGLHDALYTLGLLSGAHRYPRCHLIVLAGRRGMRDLGLLTGPQSGQPAGRAVCLHAGFA